MSGASVEKEAASDPDVKATGEISDLQVRLYGSDTAIATFKTHVVSTNHKNKNHDFDTYIATLDVWKKIDGQWKCIAGTYTSTKPLPAEDYQPRTNH